MKKWIEINVKMSYPPLTFQRQIFCIGNPFIWYCGTFMIILYIILLGLYLLRRRRLIYDLNHGITIFISYCTISLLLLKYQHLYQKQPSIVIFGSFLSIGKSFREKYIIHWYHWYLSMPPKNIRKTLVFFLMFSGGIKRDQWHEMG